MIKILLRHSIIDYAINHAFEIAVLNLKYPELKQKLRGMSIDFVHYDEFSFNPITQYYSNIEFLTDRIRKLESAYATHHN